MRLYDERSRRLYVSRAGRERFLKVVNRAEPPVKALCLTLLYTGCRLSEALSLTTTSIERHSERISFRTLKKRNKHAVREVPIPPALAKTLGDLRQQRLHREDTDQQEPLPLWAHQGLPLNRITGYRWVKAAMAKADIHGPQASPKGLRHGYGVHALRCGVQLNMLQKWMGHASMTTTAIYANAVGQEELEIARRMW